MTNLLTQLLTRNSNLSRAERIRRDGSPPFRYRPASIGATATVAIYLDGTFPLSCKYAPLDWMEIANADVVDLTLTINGNEVYPVPAGTARKIDEEVGIRTVAITNDDAAVASTQYKITLTFLRKPLTMDRWIRGL